MGDDCCLGRCRRSGSSNDGGDISSDDWDGSNNSLRGGSSRAHVYLCRLMRLLLLLRLDRATRFREASFHSAAVAAQLRRLPSPLLLQGLLPSLIGLRPLVQLLLLLQAPARCRGAPKDAGPNQLKDHVLVCMPLLWLLLRRQRLWWLGILRQLGMKRLRLLLGAGLMMRCEGRQELLLLLARCCACPCLVRARHATLAAPPGAAGRPSRARAIMGATQPFSAAASTSVAVASAAAAAATAQPAGDQGGGEGQGCQRARSHRARSHRACSHRACSQQRGGGRPRAFEGQDAAAQAEATVKAPGSVEVHPMVEPRRCLDSIAAPSGHAVRVS